MNGSPPQVIIVSHIIVIYGYPIYVLRFFIIDCKYVFIKLKKKHFFENCLCMGNNSGYNRKWVYRLCELKN